MSSYAIDVKPEGKLITNFPEITENSTVRMFLNSKITPIINITPGRPTIVQFPEEIRTCVNTNKMIKVDYGDKSGSSSQGGDTKNNNSEWYSSAIFNVNPEAIKSVPVNKILDIPVIIVVCKVRVSEPDSTNNESYSWQAVGIKFVKPEETYFVVYLLKNNGKSTESLLSEKEIEKFPYVDVTKMQTGTPKKNQDSFIAEKSLKKTENEAPLKNKKIEKIEPKKESELSILDLYDFTDLNGNKQPAKKI